MASPPESSDPRTSTARFSVWGALLSHLRGQYRLRLEERDWRRRMVLAGRKMQSLQMSLMEDLSDTKALKQHLDHLGPRLDHLEGLLGSTRDHIEKLETSSRVAVEDALAQEREARQRSQAAEVEARNALEQISVRHEQELAAFDRQRLSELGSEQERRGRAEERIAELEAQVQSAFLREQEEIRRRMELEQVEAQLEARMDELQSLVQEIPLATDPLATDPPAPDPMARVIELEERLRTAEMERLNLDMRRTQEMTDFADHTHRRVAELERNLRMERESTARLKKGEDELDRLRDVLEEKTKELEAVRALLEEPDEPESVSELMAMEDSEEEWEDEEWEEEPEEGWEEEPEALREEGSA